MAMNTSLKKTTYKSNLTTLINIFKELSIISTKIQRNILKQNWQNLYKLAAKQEQLNLYFYKTISNLDTNDNNSFKRDTEIINLKNILKEKIKEYKETENINAKLLRDSLFIAKQKVEKFYNLNSEKETYSKEMKKDTNLWNNKPVMLDSFA